MAQRANEKQMQILRRKGSRLRVSANATKTAKPAGISLGQNEIAVISSIETSAIWNGTTLGVNSCVLDIGLLSQPESYLDSSPSDTVDKVYDDPNIIYLRNYSVQLRATTTDENKMDRSIFQFLPPVPIVRDVSFFVNARVLNNSEISDVYFSLYYLKMTASSDIILKLLKFYGDTKDIYRFRQRSDEVNKPIPTP